MSKSYKCWCQGSLAEEIKDNCIRNESGAPFCITSYGCISEWEKPPNMKEQSFYGCASEESTLFGGVPFECTFPNTTRYRSYCCYTEFCNSKPNQVTINDWDGEALAFSTSKPPAIGPILILFFGLMIVFLLAFRCYKKRKAPLPHQTDVENPRISASL